MLFPEPDVPSTAIRRCRARARVDVAGFAGETAGLPPRAPTSAAVSGPLDAVVEMRTAFARRAKLAHSMLNGIEGVTCLEPEGAFYAFADIRGTGMSSSEAADLFLREAHVAVTPGIAFGAAGEGHVRLSFATSDDALAAAVQRIGNLLGRKSD